MKKKKRFTTGRIILLLLIILLIFIGRPLGYLLYTYFKDPDPVKTTSKEYINDASHLNESRIKYLVNTKINSSTALVDIVVLIKLAAKEGNKISIAGARHSMGGHTIYPGGIVLDMSGFDHMQLDSVRNILTVGAGARWSQVIPFLDRHGRSVAVMQSNNSFSVGGSVSVNCHGWQPNTPPIASTVESFRLINAQGDLITCSRTENPELFSLVLGGYGLFGVILDVQLKVVPNKTYTAHQYVISSKDYIREYDRLAAGQSGIGMVYGRININPGNFMNEAILSVFTIDDSTALQPLQKGSYTSIRRTVFRGSANSAYGKNLRWKAEKLITSQMNGRHFTRNQLLNEGVEVFENTDTAYTDILHEYFIPKDSVTRFISALKNTLPHYKVDLLNITLRNVKKDNDAFLRYAHEEVFGFVMLFNQARKDTDEQEMKRLTQALIDTAIGLRGTYYLPYRLHATKEQLYRAYPQIDDFFSLKKKYDSAELFQNKFYTTYK